MRKLFLFIFFSSLAASSQTMDFGLEAQQNNNLVVKWLLSNELSEYNRAFSILDNNGDTLDVHFNTFSMANNFEVPVYFRFNMFHRWFLDIKLSNTTHTLNMEGVTNYNDSWYTQHFGTLADFIALADSSGFGLVDTSDYVNYINGAHSLYQRKVSSREEFKVLSLTTNIGLRLLPHRSIHPFIYAGFTVKGKYRKFTYNYFDFDNPNVYNTEKVSSGVSRFPETSYYVNLGFGLEFYRFRAGAYYQGGTHLKPSTGQSNDIVVNINPSTPFERIQSYGFYLTANLFSTPLGKTVVQENLGDNEVVLSNVQRTKTKWDFGFRLNRRGFNDVTSFYADPEKQLSILKRDSILFYNGSQIQNGEKIELATIHDVKRISWTGQIEFYLTRYLGRRVGLEFMVGSSSLSTDFETSELTATIIHPDSTSSAFVYSNQEPRIRPGVYRTTSSLTNINVTLVLKPVDRDLFSLNLYFGIGATGMAQRTTSYTDFPEGVNELSIYADLNENYYFVNNSTLYGHTGPLTMDLSAGPDKLLQDFGNTRLDSSWPTPQKRRGVCPSMRFGFETVIDRFTIGLNLERSMNYMDGFFFNTYKSLSLSVGYKLISRNSTKRSG